MEEQLFKQESSIEEKKYSDAAGLQESIPYITRFERKVIALNNAAKKFEKLEGYKDSEERSVLCKELAQKIEKEGCRDAYELAIRKEEEAKTKSDFLDAIVEFKRVWKKEEYAAEAQKHITSCKKAMLRIEKKAVWKRRVIVLAVLAIAAFVFSKTIAFPFVKGMVHQQMGHYRAAVNNYKLAMSMPGAGGRLRACYYYLGLEQQERGDKEKALRLFVKAENYEDAKAKAAALEKEFLQGVEEGQKVTFGNMRWYVLDKKEDRVLLLSL